MAWPLRAVASVRADAGGHPVFRCRWADLGLRPRGGRMRCAAGAPPLPSTSPGGRARRRTAITGNPRYDTIEPAAWEREVAGCSNTSGSPSDRCCSCPTRSTIRASVRRREDGAVRAVRRRGGDRQPLSGEAPSREDAAAFCWAPRRIQQGSIHVETTASLFAVLAASVAAVVLASDRGTRSVALLFSLPLRLLTDPGTVVMSSKYVGATRRAAARRRRAPGQALVRRQRRTVRRCDRVARSASHIAARRPAGSEARSESTLGARR